MFSTSFRKIICLIAVFLVTVMTFCACGNAETSSIDDTSSNADVSQTESIEETTGVAPL